MKNFHRYLLLAALAVSTTGCFRIRYITNTPAESSPAYDRWHHNAIAGLWEVSDAVNVSEICPQGFAEVDNETTFLNWLAGAVVQNAVSVPLYLATSGKDAAGNATPGFYLPFSLWTPQSVSVTCSRVSAPATAPTR